MKTRLPKVWIDYLVHEPETGMGYQVADIAFKSGRVLNSVIIYNCEELEVPAGCDVNDIVNIKIRRVSPPVVER